MEFKDLEFVIAVYEARSFSGAARRLGTVQSNVSARILKLEKSLGTSLFTRLWRTVAPTTPGARLYRGAQRLLTQLRGVERLIRAPRKPAPSRAAAAPRSSLRRKRRRST
jgi:DNA-binding transcriptional LysR family regulator